MGMGGWVFYFKIGKTTAELMFEFSTDPSGPLAQGPEARRARGNFTMNFLNYLNFFL